MVSKYTIIASTQDVASANIMDNLFRLKGWEKVHEDARFKVYRYKNFDLIVIEDHQAFQDDIDASLEAMGYKPEAIIFTSKHRGKENRKMLIVHFTGNTGEGSFGGKGYHLATAAPRLAASILKNLSESVTSFNISYGATHHGPSEIRTPSVHVEIGNTIEEWKDSSIGEIVARAILEAREERDMQVYVGIGGSRYMAKETALAMDAGIAFGHMIPDDAIPAMTDDVIKQVFEKSGTKLAYLDRLSIPSQQRQEIEDRIARLGYEVHTEAKIRSMAFTPLLRCKRLADIARQNGIDTRPYFTEGIKRELSGCMHKECSSCPFGATVQIDEKLLDMAWKADRRMIEDTLQRLNVAYFYMNGQPAGLLVGLDHEIHNEAMKLISGCIESLKAGYEVKYDYMDEALYVSERQSDAGMAKSLGVTGDRAIGEPCNGNTVGVKDTAITPGMACTENTIRIKLSRNMLPDMVNDTGLMARSATNIKATDSKSLNGPGRDIIDGEKGLPIPVQIGDTDEEIMQVMKALRTSVLVIGCGGGGSNSITRMAAEGITGAKLYVVNTDAQHLLHTRADKKFLIGKKLTRGLGAGGIPEIGENTAKESIGELKAAIAKADMVLVTCGLGGGTGTGSAPVIASLAKESGALTIAIVTMPFKAEGVVRRNNAETGLAKLKEIADTVIIIPNDKLLAIAPDIPLQKAFGLADDVLMNAVKNITELITKPGLMNLDFADVKTVMTGGGEAVIGFGEAKGEDKAGRSVRMALESPLLDRDISGAAAAIVNVLGGSDMSLSDAEKVVEEVYNATGPDTRIIWGARVDSELKDTIRTMVIIAGLKAPEQPVKEKVCEALVPQTGNNKITALENQKTPQRHGINDILKRFFKRKTA